MRTERLGARIVAPEVGEAQAMHHLPAAAASTATSGAAQGFPRPLGDVPSLALPLPNARDGAWRG